MLKNDDFNRVKKRLFLNSLFCVLCVLLRLNRPSTSLVGQSWPRLSQTEVGIECLLAGEALDAFPGFAHLQGLGGEFIGVQIHRGEGGRAGIMRPYRASNYGVGSAITTNYIHAKDHQIGRGMEEATDGRGVSHHAREGD